MSTSPLSANSAQILIIDDNAENRLLLVSQLAMEGYRLSQASNGREGIEAALKLHPDLILLDVMMPEINGFEVCARLKSMPETTSIPVIMVTALREVQYRIRGIEVGADEFLSRPHHREELLVRVRALIQLRRARLRLEEERNRLQLLYNISRAISTQLDIEQMMADILSQTQAAVGATKGSIILVDERLEVTHRILVRTGLSPEVANRVTQAVMWRGLAGWLVRNNRGVLIENTDLDNRWLTLSGDDDSTRSVIGVPLSRADHVIGVLILMHPQAGHFKPAHLVLLETIGAQIAASIENAYLFTEINEERGKLGAILSQSSDAIITTDELWRISLVNAAAEKLFRLSGSAVVGRSMRQIPQFQLLVGVLTDGRQSPVAREIALDTGEVLYAGVSPIAGVGYVIVLQDISELKRVEELKLEQERREKALVKETFSRYMGPRLVEHVLSNEPGLLARQERRKAVVLFADLRDFTRMVVKVQPNEAILLLNEFFATMTDVVYEFDGTIFDLTGDEVMVGFNVPFDQPDAVYRALLTAVTMQKKFGQLRVRWFEEMGTLLGLGIGIDQGVVVVGNVGAETRMTFRMVGEAVNIAHRLVDLAEDGQIVVTESVYRAAQETASGLAQAVDFQSMGDVWLKGKEKAQVLYRGVVGRIPLPAGAS
ncbi:MAG: response regulator [Ardenticatenaceae bacterium]|nr:response regulator [Anaerolineales bacterium]MCB8918197.1 response regulator [Ardenticatenaceae bacterium]